MYPTKVAMLQSAANWSRVAEPLVPIDFNKSLRFSLSKDTPDIFGITSRTAVVYVKDAEKLSAYAPGSVFRISVLASKHTFKGAYAIEFNVQLKKAEKPTCSNNMHDNMDNFCSKFKVMLHHKFLKDRI